MAGRRTGTGWGAALVAVVMAAPLSAQEDTFDWSGSLDAGQELEVKGITGSIRAELAPGNTARVTARKRGDRGDFDRVQIRTVETRYGITVCAVYGEGSRDRDSCEHRDRDDEWRDRRHDDDLDVSVEFVVELPAGVDLVATMVTGDVEVEGVRSDVDATSVTGDVRVSTTGVVEATSVSGDLDLEMGSPDRSHQFRTVSGDITLRLPEDTDADLRFQSLSGDLDSDFDMDVRRQDERWIGSNVRASIGDGGPSLAFKTVSGDVRLVRTGRRAR